MGAAASGGTTAPAAATCAPSSIISETERNWSMQGDKKKESTRRGNFQLREESTNKWWHRDVRPPAQGAQRTIEKQNLKNTPADSFRRLTSLVALRKKKAWVLEAGNQKQKKIRLPGRGARAHQEALPMTRRTIGRESEKNHKREDTGR